MCWISSSLVLVNIAWSDYCWCVMSNSLDVKSNVPSVGVFSTIKPCQYVVIHAYLKLLDLKVNKNAPTGLKTC